MLMDESPTSRALHFSRSMCGSSQSCMRGRQMYCISGCQGMRSASVEPLSERHCGFCRALVDHRRAFSETAERLSSGLKKLVEVRQDKHHRN
jgi:hypothetical protein